MKKYQPWRQDFLINRDWGLSLDSISRDEAKARGLVSWKRRWVTPEEKQQVKSEFNVYRHIDWARSLSMLRGILGAIAVIVILAKPDIPVFTVADKVGAVVTTVCYFGAWWYLGRYAELGRRLFAIAFGVDLVTLFYDVVAAPATAAHGSLLWIILDGVIISSLYSQIGNSIFSEPPAFPGVGAKMN
ncbi:MAG TPA: hypothetical protein V6D47_04935 [Oscillatoriaceae cyanobacterium]